MCALPLGFDPVCGWLPVALQRLNQRCELPVCSSLSARSLTPLGRVTMLSHEVERTAGLEKWRCLVLDGKHFQGPDPKSSKRNEQEKNTLRLPDARGVGAGRSHDEGMSPSWHRGSSHKPWPLGILA